MRRLLINARQGLISRWLSVNATSLLLLLGNISPLSVLLISQYLVSIIYLNLSPNDYQKSLECFGRVRCLVRADGLVFISRLHNARIVQNSLILVWSLSAGVRQLDVALLLTSTRTRQPFSGSSTLFQTKQLKKRSSTTARPLQASLAKRVHTP